MTLQILGVGTAVPPHAISQADAADQAVNLLAGSGQRTTAIPALYRRAGVHTRHLVLLESSPDGAAARQSFYPPARGADDAGPSTAQRMQRYESDAPGLAARAARAALADAGVGAAQVTHLVTVGCSGFSAPGVDIQLIEELGLPRDVARTHTGFMGCHGALNGLRVAGGFASSDPQARVLVCAVELCSLHHQYTCEPQQLVANSLFSDGAGAVVGQGSRAADLPWQIVQHRSALVPGTADLMSWRIGDHGFQMTLSPRVPEVIRGLLGPWLEAWLAEHGLAIAQIRAWAVHPGGPKILTACAAAAGFDPALLGVSQEVLSKCGNMSSPTVLFILQRLRRQPDTLPCVALAFGPGLTIEAALIR